MSYEDIVEAQKNRDAKVAGRIPKRKKSAPTAGKERGSRSQEVERRERRVARPSVGGAKGVDAEALSGTSGLSGTRCQRRWSMASTLLQDITVVMVGERQQMCSTSKCVASANV
jgi:hypothetical protein